MKKKNNKLDFGTVSTGGHVTKQSVDKRTTEALIPPKEKEELGFAKASPVFVPIVPKTKASEKDEKKAIEDNIKTVE